MSHSFSLWASLSCCLLSGAAASAQPSAGGAAEVGELSAALQGGVVVTLRNVKSGRCLGVDRASTASGALLKQFNCDDRPNQRWRVQRRGIEHTFVNVKSGKCMGVDGASVRPGANIGQYNCGGGAPNQSWVLVSDTPDLVRNIRNAKSKLCIGVDRGSTANGAQLKQFACNLTAPNQEWRVIVR